MVITLVYSCLKIKQDTWITWSKFNRHKQAYLVIFRPASTRPSDGPHWAVLPGDLTRNEIKFLEEQNIMRLDMDLNAFFDAVTEVLSAAA